MKHLDSICRFFLICCLACFWVIGGDAITPSQVQRMYDAGLRCSLDVFEQRDYPVLVNGIHVIQGRMGSYLEGERMK